VNDTTHIHDFNPGFGPAVSSVDSGNGFGTRVFWTAVIPDGDVQVHFGDGGAEMHVQNLAVLDYFAPNGFAGNASLGPQWQTASVDATVSFDVVWGGPVTRDVMVKDSTYGFAGHFKENQPTVSWSAVSSSGFTFTSNPGDFSTSLPEVPGVNGVTAPLNFFAEIGHERNGIFFPQGDDHGDSAQGDSQGSSSQGNNRGDNSAVSTGAFAILASKQSNAAAPSGDMLARKQTEPAPLTASPSALPDGALASAQPVQSGAGAAQHGAVDHVFADLENSALADVLQGAEALP
jgi:hypothetical protein